MVLTGSSRYTLFAMILCTSSILLQIQVAMSVLFQLGDTIDGQGVETGFERSHVVARRAPGKLQVPVDLWIAHLSAVSRLKYFQHWSLVIDTKHAFSAEAEDSGVPAPLAVKSFMYSSDKKDKLTSIDCHAEFKNQAELNRVLGELVSMKMTLMPSHKGKNFQDGGTCMNYVWNALEHLRKGGHIPEITKKFVEIFNRDYQKVKDEVWPGS